jgi:CDP-diacylglycerol--glycerol-3-phosphate 3-phosphatidyltransferase
MTLDKWPAAFVLLFLATMLDIVDGQVARRLHQVSKQGVFLDIMVDKIVILATFFFIGMRIDVLFFYLGILLLVREYSMDTMRSIAASNQVVIPADRLSKIKGVLLMTAMLIVIGNYAFIYNCSWNSMLQTSGTVLAVTGTLLAYVTLVCFLVAHRKALA